MFRASSSIARVEHFPDLVLEGLLVDEIRFETL